MCDVYAAGDCAECVPVQAAATSSFHPNATSIAHRWAENGHKSRGLAAVSKHVRFGAEDDDHSMGRTGACSEVMGQLMGINPAIFCGFRPFSEVHNLSICRDCKKLGDFTLRQNAAH